MTHDPQSTPCARCGLVRREHAYNGACYGVCGEFVEPETTGWRPIETAPKDGTSFMIWVRRIDDGAEFHGGMARSYPDTDLLCDTHVFASRRDWYRVLYWHPMPPNPESAP